MIQSIKKSVLSFLSSSSFTNLLIRGINLLLKFVFQIVIVKAIAIEHFGLYSYYRNVINITVFIMGFEIHQYVLRRIAANQDKGIIASQYILYLKMYFLFIPFYYYFLYKITDANTGLSLLLLGILIFEHFSGEQVKTLVALKMSIRSNVQFTIRNGLIPLLALGIIYISFPLVTYELLFKFYLLFLILFAIYATYHNGIVSTIISEYKNVAIIEFIRDAVPVSSRYFLISLMFNLAAVIDTFIMKYYGYIDDIALISFYRNIANMPIMLVYASVISVYLPDLVTQRDLNVRNKLIKKIYLYNMAIYIASVLIIVSAISPLLEIVQKELLKNNLSILAIMLISNAIYIISMVPYSVMYSEGRDRTILISASIYLSILFLMDIILIAQHKAFGAAYATLISTSIYCLYMIYANKKSVHD